MRSEVAPDEVTQERVARNDAAFREANERIREAAERYHADFAVPFICECAAEDCSAIVQLSLDEYEDIRSDSHRFFNAPGHESAARGKATVIGRNDRYVVVEKTGLAGEIVEELDPNA